MLNSNSKRLVATTFEILKKLGIDLPSEVGHQQKQINQLEKAIAEFLTDKSIADLANLPDMIDPNKLAAVSITGFYYSLILNLQC